MTDQVIRSPINLGRLQVDPTVRDLARVVGELQRTLSLITGYDGGQQNPVFADRNGMVGVRDIDYSKMSCTQVVRADHAPFTASRCDLVQMVADGTIAGFRWNYLTGATLDQYCPPWTVGIGYSGAAAVYFSTAWAWCHPVQIEPAYYAGSTHNYTFYFWRYLDNGEAGH